MSDDATTPEAGTVSRRQLLRTAGLGLGLGTAAATLPALLPMGASAAPHTTVDVTCAADTAEQEVGPFYVADGLLRSDITAGEDGVPLTVTITLTDSTTCAPLVGVAVDVWHANSLGVYSDEASENTSGETYLRGVQITNSAGQVTFTSIVPGWYSGRTIHWHLRVYTGGSTSGSTYNYSGATLIHTGQLFFDPALDTAVAGVAPYTSNRTARTVNSTDRVYTEQDGDDMLVTATGSTSKGYVGTISLTVPGDGVSGGTNSTTLSIKSSASRVAAGTSVTLSGTLLDSTTSDGLADQDVTLHLTIPSGNVYTKVLETDDGGNWSYTFAPNSTATYSVSYTGTSTHASSASSVVTVAVNYRVLVSYVSPTNAAKYGIGVSGSLVPAREGRVITVQEILSSGTLRTVTTTTTDAKGAWLAQFHLTKGQHKLRAVVASDRYDTGTASRTVVVTRT